MPETCSKRSEARVKKIANNEYFARSVKFRMVCFYRICQVIERQSRLPVASSLLSTVVWKINVANDASLWRYCVLDMFFLWQYSGKNNNDKMLSLLFRSSVVLCTTNNSACILSQ